MKLTDLNPRFVGADFDRGQDKDGNQIPERSGIGLTFDCPCGNCGRRPYVGFKNPIDGGAPYASDGQPLWDRTGDTFETITIKPSILRKEECKWHGYLTNGEITTC